MRSQAEKIVCIQLPAWILLKSNNTSSLLVCVVTTANAVSNALYLTTVILIHKIFIYLFIYLHCLF